MANVSELGPRSRAIDLKVKLMEKREERQVTAKATGRQHRVAEFLIGDESGCILMSVWDDAIDAMEVGASYDIKNAYITTFRNSMRLSVGKYGTMEKVDEAIEANAENNVSEKFVEDERDRGRRF